MFSNEGGSSFSTRYVGVRSRSKARPVAHASEHASSLRAHPLYPLHIGEGVWCEKSLAQITCCGGLSGALRTPDRLGFPRGLTALAHNHSGLANKCPLTQ
jgi:hypothetical protein